MFMENLEKNQKSYTENGAIGYATTGSKLVDLNFSIPSFRTIIDTHLFELALAQDEKLTLKWLLYLRDIRNGVGERKSFREFVRHLVKVNEELANKFLSIVPIEEYGRWDDYIDIMACSSDTAKIIANKLFTQLVRDLENCKKNKPISLLAKWLPSENASSYKSKTRARFIRGIFNMDSKTYRKTLSTLRSYLDVVERKMSSNNWVGIKYDTVPSRANLIYADAFIEHDKDRRRAYLESLEKGETRINAQALFLHDIVHAYKNKDYDTALEQMWKAQCTKLDGFGNTLVVRDGSGSMECSVGRNTTLSAQEVADAITLYCAENNTGEFKNKFITFSNIARLIDIGWEETLQDKLDHLHNYYDVGTTNIEDVFTLILNTAVENNLAPEEMPKTVLIVSDMEFNHATYKNPDETLFNLLARRFKNNGYNLPKLVFWNVNSRTNVIPLTQNENGVILISGFSKNLMSMVMSSELDPYKALVNQLESDRYKIVDKIYDK